MIGAETGCNRRRPPMQSQTGPSAGFPYHFNLLPADPGLNACPQGLRGRFLGRETGRETFRAVVFSEAIANLSRQINAMKKSLAKAGDCLFNARNFYHVDADADDHGVVITDSCW